MRVFGLGLFLHPAFLVGVFRACALLRAPHFPPPLAGAACGVGLCGGRRGWVSPPLPPFFWLRRGCVVLGRNLALWWSPPRVPVLGPLVSAPPGPFVWVASVFLSYCWLPATSPVGCVPACRRCPFQRPFGGRVVVVGLCLWLYVDRLDKVVLRCPFEGPRGCRLWCYLVGGVASCGVGCAASRLCACPSPALFCFLWARLRGWAGVLPPSVFLFWEGGLPVPPSAFPGLVHALVGIRCG